MSNCPFFGPTLLNNYRETNIRNTKLFSRNFPSDKYKVDVDFRPGYQICNNSVCNTKPVSHRRKERSCLFPGNGNGSEYLNLIDTESELKRISNNSLYEPLVFKQCFLIFIILVTLKFVC